MQKNRIFEFLDLFKVGKGYDLSLFMNSRVYSKEISFNSMRGKGMGIDGLKKSFIEHHNSFPDWRIESKTIEGITENMAVIEYVFSGTYSTPVKGICPTKSTLEFSNKISLGQRFQLHTHFVYLFDESNLYRMYSILDLSTLEIKSSESKQSSPAALKKAFSLSSRELDCLALILMGFSAKSAATVLFISPRTVETHLQNAYVKLGCQGKKQCHEQMVASQMLPFWQEHMSAILCHQ